MTPDKEAMGFITGYIIGSVVGLVVFIALLNTGVLDWIYDKIFNQ